MSHPIKEKSEEKPVLIVPILLYTDDTSGHISSIPSTIGVSFLLDYLTTLTLSYRTSITFAVLTGPLSLKWLNQLLRNRNIWRVQELCATMAF